MLLKGFKPINSCQIIIDDDDDDNSLIGIPAVPFVLCANAGDGSFLNTILTKWLDI